MLAGGTLTFEDSNMNGMGKAVSATVSTDNFVSPGDDLSFQVLQLGSSSHATHLHHSRSCAQHACSVQAMAIHSTGLC